MASLPRVRLRGVASRPRRAAGLLPSCARLSRRASFRVDVTERVPPEDTQPGNLWASRRL